MSSTYHYRGYRVVLGLVALAIYRDRELIGYRNTLREARALVDSLHTVVLS